MCRTLRMLLKHVFTPEQGSHFLSDFSPPLSDTGHLPVAIPGTSQNESKEGEEERVTLVGMDETVKVFCSKEFARQIGMMGSDGGIYSFILKANEDGRLGERIMQLFSLINSVFSKNTLMEGYFLRTFSNTPLSYSCNLISFLTNHKDTFDLIDNYRCERKIIETPFPTKYDDLRPEQKYSTFLSLLQANPARELSETLFCHSPVSFFLFSFISLLSLSFCHFFVSLLFLLFVDS